jgi:hypothetical protein
MTERELEAIECGERAEPKVLGSASHALGVSVHWFFSGELR